MRGDRLFVAVPLPAAARRELTDQLPDIPGRRVLPDKWHFTLRFLGETAPSLRDRLIEELRGEVFGGGFELQLEGLGAFPRASHARVLWVGVTRGADRLRELANNVNLACARAGLQADARPYAPHLTLSRLEPARDVRALLRAPASPAVHTLVEELHVMRSHLGHGPPRYETLARYTLASAE